jgi:hypothetical protein
LATTNTVALASEWTVTCIDLAITQATERIVSAITGLSTSNKDVAKAHFEGMTDVLKKIELSRRHDEGLRKKANTSNQASVSCQVRDGAMAWGVGMKAMEGIRQDYADHNRKRMSGGGKIRIRDAKGATENIYRMSKDMEGQQPDGKMMFPKNGLVQGDDLRRANELIRQVVNPYPTAMEVDSTLVEEKEGESAVAKEVRYRTSVKQSRLAVAQETNEAILGMYSPTMPAGKALQELQKHQQLQGNSVTMSADGGNVSAMTFLKEFSNSARMGNAPWADEMSLKEEIGILREMVFMQAQQMEMERLSLEFQMRQAHLLSTVVGILVDRSDNPLVNQASNQSRPTNDEAGDKAK